MDSSRKRMMHILREYPPDTDELKIQNMNVCYCRYCGEYAMILPCPLDSLPLRKRDMSRVITEKGFDFKYTLSYGGNTYIRRENGIEKQCRYYCTHCKLLIAYRLSPPGQESKYFYIVNGSLTIDPDIMLHEVKKYKVKVPEYIHRDPEDPSNSTLLFINVNFGKQTNSLHSITDNALVINMKYQYEEEGKSNGLVLQFLSALMNVPLIDLSMTQEDDRLAIRINNINSEDFYLKLKPYLP